MEKLEFVVDPFCEKAFWNNRTDQSMDGNLTNPLCAFTGLVLVFMAVCTRNVYYTRRSKEVADFVECPECFGTGKKEDDTFPTLSITLLCLCRGSLGIVGLGTVVFHSMDDATSVKAFNFRMCDRMPIILMCTNIFVLYFVKLREMISEHVLTVYFFLMYVYMGGLLLAVDSTTYEYMTLKLNDPIDSPQSSYESLMNVFLLLPLGLILVYASFTRLTSCQVLYVWGQIFFSLGIWTINAYLCRKNRWMFVLHAVYHVTIAYTFLYAACLGMTLDGEWEMVDYWWPMVEPAEEAAQLESRMQGNPCKIQLNLRR
jgi:hypothetical protein